jgi:hypothetical protein
MALCLTQHLPIDWHFLECFLTFITKLSIEENAVQVLYSSTDFPNRKVKARQ